MLILETFSLYPVVSSNLGDLYGGVVTELPLGIRNTRIPCTFLPQYAQSQNKHPHTLNPRTPPALRSCDSTAVSPQRFDPAYCSRSLVSTLQAKDA